MRMDYLGLVLLLILGSCSGAVITARIHCEITGNEADCPRIVVSP